MDSNWDMNSSGGESVSARVIHAVSLSEGRGQGTRSWDDWRWIRVASAVRRRWGRAACGGSGRGILDHVEQPVEGFWQAPDGDILRCGCREDGEDAALGKRARIGCAAAGHSSIPACPACLRVFFFFFNYFKKVMNECTRARRCRNSHENRKDLALGLFQVELHGSEELGEQRDALVQHVGRRRLAAVDDPDNGVRVRGVVHDHRNEMLSAAARTDIPRGHDQFPAARCRRRPHGLDVESDGGDAW